jgi:hypothetical protein
MIPDRPGRQIDIELRPEEVVWGDMFHATNLLDRRLAKPWKLLERKKELLVSKQHPEAVVRDMKQPKKPANLVSHFAESSMFGWRERCCITA